MLSANRAPRQFKVLTGAGPCGVWLLGCGCRGSMCGLVVSCELWARYDNGGEVVSRRSTSNLTSPLWPRRLTVILKRLEDDDLLDVGDVEVLLLLEDHCLCVMTYSCGCWSHHQQCACRQNV
eukprot:1619048-Amphidinium_carterae.3